MNVGMANALITCSVMLFETIKEICFKCGDIVLIHSGLPEPLTIKTTALTLSLYPSGADEGTAPIKTQPL